MDEQRSSSGAAAEEPDEDHVCGYPADGCDCGCCCEPEEPFRKNPGSRGITP
jgi:hypothetical protein